MNTEILFTIVYLFYLQLQYTVACNGYRLIVHQVTNCRNSLQDDVIVFKNINATFSRDCFIIPRGCTVIRRPFNTGQIHYKVKKPPLTSFEGDDDICSEDKSMVMSIVSSLGLPKKCPVKARKVCFGASRKVSMNSFKNKLSLIAGTTTLKVNIAHDVGNTCLDIKISVRR